MLATCAREISSTIWQNEATAINHSARDPNNGITRLDSVLVDLDDVRVHLRVLLVEELLHRAAVGAVGLDDDDDAVREALDEHARVIVAAACVAPLIESVLCKDVSEVDAEEYRRASLVLGSLCWMDRQVRPGDHLFLPSSD